MQKTGFLISNSFCINQKQGIGDATATLGKGKGDRRKGTGIRCQVSGLLNFWFAGCKPNEQELPYEKNLVGQLLDEDFRLVNICTNTPESTWKKFIEENELPGLNLYAKGNWDSKLADSYQISSFPTYVLIEREGKVIL